MKGAKQQKKVVKNVMSNSANRLREIFSEVEKELASKKGICLNFELTKLTPLRSKLLNYSWP